MLIEQKHQHTLVSKSAKTVRIALRKSVPKRPDLNSENFERTTLVSVSVQPSFMQLRVSTPSLKNVADLVVFHSPNEWPVAGDNSFVHFEHKQGSVQVALFVLPVWSQTVNLMGLNSLA